ncbi:MAG: DNA repair protein RecN [Bacteroidaceae bacterium]|nr:DNA repair protein RecN [Bacteroidaceae bacterium]
MIKNLHIENYALIEHLDIDLHAGFSVITGETGAGKSIILGAIGLLLGQRADIKSIKTGASKCVVEATFDVQGYGFDSFFEENDLDFDGSECIIRRELTSSGKSRAFINDVPVQLTLLKEIGEQLIDVHSQHKNLLLGKEDFQLNVIDVIASNADLIADYKKEYKEYNSLCKKLEDAISNTNRNREEADYMRFQYNQLAEANLSADEQSELEEESDTLSHAEDIKQALYQANALLADGGEGADALMLIKQSMTALNGISNVFAQSEELSNRIDSCYIELKDIADEISSRCDSIEYNPSRLEWVNDRLNTIYTLQKKHNVDTVEALLKIQAELDEKLSMIDNSDEYIDELRHKCADKFDKALGIARKLSDRRHKAAVEIEKRMVELLVPLGMPNVQFKAELTETQDKDIKPRLTPSGIDEVAFLFSANKNSALQQVSQVASGGEIARVMLSLKALIAGAIKLPTIIFDEIDTGVSGSIAEKMAKIMREMGDHDRQVISITHLPQIAALGSSHYKVYKEDKDDATVSHIIELTTQQRIEELAHMLSGEELTEAALENAKALLSINN